MHRGVLCGAVQSDQLFFCWKGQFHWHRNSGVHDRHYVLGGEQNSCIFYGVERSLIELKSILPSSLFELCMMIGRISSNSLFEFIDFFLPIRNF